MNKLEFRKMDDRTEVWGLLECGTYDQVGNIREGYYEPSIPPRADVVDLDLNDLLQIVAYMEAAAHMKKFKEDNAIQD